MKKIIALTLTVVLMLALLAGCGNTSGQGSGTVDNGTAVTVGYMAAHEPAYPSSGSSDFIQAGMIYDKLFDVDDVTGEYYSPVLESYEWTNDTTLHMVLKKGITFSDGAEMTMDDVYFSLKNYMNDVNNDKYQYYAHIDFDSSKVSDDGYELDLVWYEPYGPALRTLNCAIMQKAFTEEHIDMTDEVWYTGPVGSGPYVISESVKNSYVVFTLRDDYWDTSRTFDATQITLKFYTDESAMYMDYKAGNIDGLYDVSNETVKNIEADPDSGTVSIIPDNDVVYIHLNQNIEALKDPAVREAIAYALDMNYITDVCYGTLGTVATSHYPASFDAYVNHGPYEYNPDKAKEILTNAGYKEGDITITWISPETAPEPQIGQCVQALLGAVGITVEVQTPDFGTALMASFNGETQISDQHTMGGNPTKEPDNTLAAFYGEAVFKSFAIPDEDYNALYYAGLSTTDEEARWDIYREIDTWLWDHYLALPICEVNKAVVYNSRIASFPISAVGRSCLGTMKLN